MRPSKSIVETSKKIKNLEEGGVQKNPGKPDTANTETLNKLNILLTKNKDLKELKKKNYKEEQIKWNKLIEVNETAYATIVDSINKESCNKMNFVHKILNEINNSSTNFINEFNESIKKVETFRQDLNVKRDERGFKIDYNFYINKDNTMVHKRFALEEFLDYDYVITDSENPPKNKDSSKNLNIGLNNNDSSDFEYYRAKSILSIGEKLFVDLDNLDEKEKEINTIISNLLNCQNKIEDIEFLKIINYIENNPDNSNTFMELLVTHFCQNEFVIINNGKNKSIRKTRNPGVDLIRILAMFGIIIGHILFGGGVMVKYYKYHKFLKVFHILFFWHNNGFGLVSGIIGYKTNKYSNIIYLWFCVFLYSVAIHLYFQKYRKNSKINNNIFIEFFPVIYKRYWYFSQYFGMYLFIPVINKAVAYLTKSELKIIVFSLLFLFSFWHDFMNSHFDIFQIRQGYSVIWLLTLYIIGTYIGKYKIDYTGKKKFY